MPSLRNCRPNSKTRSKPPTTSCFRWSSGAIRRNISALRSLWCVLNGLADAPPYPVPRIGVSTSRKSCASRNLRSSRRIAARVLRISRCSGLAKKSTCLRRNRLSTFSKVVFGLGIILRQGDSIIMFEASIEGSPALVLQGTPSTPTISPRLSVRTSLEKLASDE